MNTREFTERKIMCKLIKLEHGILCKPTELTLLNNFTEYWREYNNIVTKIVDYILATQKTANPSPRIAITLKTFKNLNPAFNFECRNLKGLKIMTFNNHKSAFIFHTIIRECNMEEYFISYV